MPRPRRAAWVRAHMQPVHWYTFDDATTVCGQPLKGDLALKLDANADKVTCRNCKRSVRRRAR